MRKISGFDFSAAAKALLEKSASDAEAQELKERFGIPKQQASKGVLLLAALFDTAVQKASVPAAKELIALAADKTEDGADAIRQLIFDFKEEE